MKKTNQIKPASLGFFLRENLQSCLSFGATVTPNFLAEAVIFQIKYAQTNSEISLEVQLNLGGSTTMSGAVVRFRGYDGRLKEHGDIATEERDFFYEERNKARRWADTVILTITALK